MQHTTERPGVTKSRVLPNRLPVARRPRLLRLARRASEVCRKHGARLLSEIGLALEVAILDLEGAELRATGAEKQARVLTEALGKAKARIAELETYIYDELRPTGGDEWQRGDPTAVGPPPAGLVARCKTG